MSSVPGRCCTCKYWSSSYSVTKKFADCNRIEYEESVDHNTDDSAFIAISVLDDSGLDVNLITHSDFGCTLYEKYTPKP